MVHVMLHAMPWCLRSMFSSKQQENSHIIMIKILTCHMNYKMCHLSACSHIAQDSPVPTMSLYILLIFYKRNNIDSGIFIKLLVRSIWCFCNVSCKLDQRNLRIQTNSKKWYAVLLMQILLQKFFICAFCKTHQISE